MVKDEISGFLKLVLIISLVLMVFTLTKYYDFEAIQLKAISDQYAKKIASNQESGGSNADGELFTYTKENTEKYRELFGEIESYSFKKAEFYKTPKGLKRSYLYDFMFYKTKISYEFDFIQSDGEWDLENVLIGDQSVCLDVNKKAYKAELFDSNKMIYRIINDYNANQFEGIYNMGSEYLKKHGDHTNFDSFMSTMKSIYGNISSFEIHKKSYDTKSKKVKVEIVAYSYQNNKNVYIAIWFDNRKEKCLAGIKFYENSW